MSLHFIRSYILFFLAFSFFETNPTLAAETELKTEPCKYWLDGKLHSGSRIRNAKGVASACRAGFVNRPVVKNNSNTVSK